MEEPKRVQELLGLKSQKLWTHLIQPATSPLRVQALVVGSNIGSQGPQSPFHHKTPAPANASQTPPMINAGSALAIEFQRQYETLNHPVNLSVTMADPSKPAEAERHEMRQTGQMKQFDHNGDEVTFYDKKLFKNA